MSFFDIVAECFEHSLVTPGYDLQLHEGALARGVPDFVTRKPIRVDLQEVDEVAQDYQPPPPLFLPGTLDQVIHEASECSVVEEILVTIEGAGTLITTG